jgi:hypothetical protein
MDTRYGKRRGDGRTATADAEPLRLRPGVRSDAAARYGRGCGATRQAPAAPASDLSEFLGEDQWAEQFYDAARRHALAGLPHGSGAPAC